MKADLRTYDGIDAAILAAGGAKAVVDLQERRQPRPLDLVRLARQKAPDRVWFRQDWLAGGATLFAGKGGEGKSTVVIHEAICGAVGSAHVGAACAPYTSLIWNCEDEHDDLWRTTERVCEHQQIDMASLAEKVHIVSRYGDDNVLMKEVHRSLEPTALLERLREEVNDLGVDMLWLDNVAHLFAGNHDDRTQVTQFINLMNGLVQGRPFGVVLVAHVSRALGSEFSGSVAWENAARMRWYLGSRLPDQRFAADDGSSETASLRYLAKRKSNYSSRDYIRMNMRNGLLIPEVPDDSHVGGIVRAVDDKRADQFCIDGFKRLCALGIRTTDGKTSPDFLPTQMVAKGFATPYNKSEMAGAMNRLMSRGIFIRAEVAKHANRSPKFGLQLKELPV